MQVSGNSNSGYQQPDPGTYNAVCTRVIDLGTQASNYKGEQKKARKVLLAWELEQYMADGKPVLATNRFTASIHPKATLGKFLENWRGKAFTDEERNGFDLKTLLGAPCLLTLVKNGDYTNVTSAAKLPKGMPRLEAVGELMHLDLTHFDSATYAKLSEGLRGTIAKSPEYDKATGGEGMGNAPDSHNDDIPF